MVAGTWLVALSLATMVRAYPSSYNSLKQPPKRYSLQFLKETERLIRDFFPFDGDKILNHGCWCGNLNTAHTNGGNLGGAIVVDKLDELCHNWLKARYRSDRHTRGICKSDDIALERASYQMTIKEIRYMSTCQASTIRDRFISQCEKMDCEIDRKFLILIDFYIQLNPNYATKTVEDDHTCYGNSRREL